MIKIIPGIYQIQLPLPNISLEYVNAYLVQGDNECLLIDTGWNTEEAFDSLERQLAEIGIDFRDIAQIVVTHTDVDHYGLTGRLKQVSNAKIALHYIGRKEIESKYSRMDKFFQKLEQYLHTNGVPTEELPRFSASPSEIRALTMTTLPDITLQGGETIPVGSFSFKVIWTPGHSTGHICLYEPTQKILFSGDHILPTITPYIGLRSQFSNNPLDDYLDSLNMVKQLDVNLILPGHENPFTGLQRRVKELIQHHERRNSEILENIRAKPKTAYQIATGMTWMSDTSGIVWKNLTPLDRRLAIMETLAHLESMRFSGKVDKFSRNSIIYYRIPDITGTVKAKNTKESGK